MTGCILLLFMQGTSRFLAEGGGGGADAKM